MPFVTEEIWSFLPGSRGLLAVAPWPDADASRVDKGAEAQVERLVEAVSALRRYRDEMGAKPSLPVHGRLVAEDFGALRGQLARMARFEFADGAAPDDEVLATVAIPGGGVQVLPSEAFDVGEARGRIAARRERLAKEIERAERNLANEQFVAKAPAAVVDQERRKLEEYREALRGLDG